MHGLFEFLAVALLLVASKHGRLAWITVVFHCCYMFFPACLFIIGQNSLRNLTGMFTSATTNTALYP